MSHKRILISGAPGSGKSTVISALEARGHRVYHEVIRELTQELLQSKQKENYRNPLEALEDYVDFNERLFFARLQDFFHSTPTPHSFYDRSFVDVVAYMDFFNQTPPKYFKAYCEQFRYDLLFYFDPWEEIYQKDSERLETFKDVLNLNTTLKEHYTCLGYTPVTVPVGTVEERVAFIEKHLMR